MVRESLRILGTIFLKMSELVQNQYDTNLKQDLKSKHDETHSFF